MSLKNQKEKSNPPGINHKINTIPAIISSGPQNHNKERPIDGKNAKIKSQRVIYFFIRYKVKC